MAMIVQKSLGFVNWRWLVYTSKVILLNSGFNLARGDQSRKNSIIRFYENSRHH